MATDAPNDPGQPPLTSAPVEGFTRDLPPPSSALAVGAHPDDVEFGCGGTLAKWAASGCVVHYVICTDGSKGTWDPTADPQRLAATRQREQREAARHLGATGEVVFLGHVDGELGSGLAERAEVAAWIRRLRPEVVLGHDPWKRYRLHPDHRHAGRLACEGIVAARDPHFFAEQRLEPHRPAKLLLWEADQPDHVEEITAWVDRKLTALEAHVSQHESTMGALETFRERIRRRAAELGGPFGLAAAEVFKRIDDL